MHATDVVGARPGTRPPPAVVGREDLHRSHRSALLRKDAPHYRACFPDTPDDLRYVWPEPPADARPRGERVAWVVRGDVDGNEIALRLRPGELLRVEGTTTGGRTTKRQRQIDRFVDDLAAGDTVVVPDGGDALLVGRLTGALDIAPDALLRQVRWLGVLPRATLDRPAALQDPQAVFALRAEPAVADLARCARPGLAPSR